MKKLFASLIACALCLSASAQNQDYVEYPHAFIGVQGGAQTIQLREHNGSTKFTPSAALSLGSMFTPEWGARINVQGVWNKMNAETFGDYKYKSFTGNLDALFNLTNALRTEKYKPFNLYLLAGAGLITNFDMSDNCPEARAITKDWYNFRAGVIADYRLSKITSVNLEVNGNYMAGSKSEVYGDGKWKLNAFLGLAFKIPFTETAVASAVAAPVTSDAEYEAAQARAAAEAEARAAAAKKAQEAELARKIAAERAATAAAAKAAEEAKINETIFFTIGKTDKAEKFNDVVEKAAAWCKKYPEKTLNVAGYADKGTGTAKINARVAEKRAAAVANAIKAKGVAADQLSISSYGDKVQPYAENDENRCVIVSSK